MPVPSPLLGDDKSVRERHSFSSKEVAILEGLGLTTILRMHTFLDMPGF